MLDDLENEIEEEEDANAEEEEAEETSDEEEELDEDGNPIAKKKEAWQMTDEDDEQASSDKVPLGAHINMKKKLKGRLSDQGDEIERLKAENEKLRAGVAPTNEKAPELPKRPKQDDFDTTEEYETALDEYDEKVAAARFKSLAQNEEIKAKQAQAVKKLNENVDAHYDRAAALLKESGISPEVYQKTDRTLREAVEAIRPNQGDLTVDYMISVLGEGSEKVMYHLGVNKAARGEFIALLAEDPGGLKASLYLGQKKAQLINTKKGISRAKSPPSDVQGDTSTSPNAVALKRKYDAAHKKNKGQAAYNIKKEAKKAGVDTSKW